MSKPTLYLYTIPFSHYCEMARWALQEQRKSFIEYVNRVKHKDIWSDFMGYWRLPRNFVKQLRTEQQDEEHPHRWLSIDVRLLSPLQTQPDRDSSNIVVAADSFSTLEKDGFSFDAHFKDLLNKDVGPCTRTIVYSHLISHPDNYVYLYNMCMNMKNVSWVQRLGFRIAPFRNMVFGKMYRFLVKGEDHVENCRSRLHAAFKEIEPMLQSNSAFAITKDGRPSPEGIALASLVYPVVFPPELSTIIAYDPDENSIKNYCQGLQDEVNMWRQTVVGQWALKYYTAYRLNSVQETA